MESTLTRKLQRKLEKVQSQRSRLLLLCAVQAVAGIPYAAYMLWPDTQRGNTSPLALQQAVLAVGWSAVGLLGFLATMVRRVQLLGVFCGLEALADLLTACANAGLVVFYELQCLADDEFMKDSRWRCGDVVVTIVYSALMFLYMAGTGIAALTLRLRIEKTGKRNLDWNSRPQRWTERNLRRGAASSALRALWGSKEAVYDEECFIKYLAARDSKYIDRCLTLRFVTIERVSDHEEERQLALNLRKGYFKLGSLLGTKVYLSQVQRLVLSVREVGEQPDANIQLAGQPLRHKRRAAQLERLARSARWLASFAPRLCRSSQGRSDRQADVEEAAARVYSLHVEGQQHFGVKSLFGLSTRHFSCALEFARFEDRERFVSFIRALLPTNIPIELLTPGGCIQSSLTSVGSQERCRASTGRARDSSPPKSLIFSEMRRRAGSGASWLASASSGAPHTLPSISTMNTEMVSILAATWNMGESASPQSLESWLPIDAYDMYAVATQECNDEHWVLSVEAHLGTNYVRVCERRMGSVVLGLYCHRRHAAKISCVESSYTPTGLLGVGTNKGAVSIAFSFRGVRMCVINAHLAAHQEKLLQRNLHVQNISKHLRLGHTGLEIPVQFNTIWCGDLNYRIDEDREQVYRLVEKRAWGQLYSRDQLQQEMASNKVLFGFEEADLAFPPSYKYVRSNPVAQNGRRLAKGLAKQPAAGCGFQVWKKKKSENERLRNEGNQTQRSADSTRLSSGGCKEVAGAPSQAWVDLSICAEATRLQQSEHALSPNGKQPSGSSLDVGADATADASASLSSSRIRRQYDKEKARVPSWCDRVLWRGLPGPWQLRGGQARDCEDVTSSDHAPVSTLIVLETPILPQRPELHHCTIYVSKLQLIRERPPQRPGSSSAPDETTAHSLLSSRTTHGKGVPLPVAGAKLQNLPPSLTVHCYFLVLQRLMADPPQFYVPLSASGAASTNVVIGPMLAQREFLQTQHIHFRITSHTGSKNTQVGQAAISLYESAAGRHVGFDAVVEHSGVPAGFNLRGEALVAYTKYIGEHDTPRPAGGGENWKVNTRARFAVSASRWPRSSGNERSTPTDHRESDMEARRPSAVNDGV